MVEGVVGWAGLAVICAYDGCIGIMVVGEQEQEREGVKVGG
jgi:hypothetical protein